MKIDFQTTNLVAVAYDAVVVAYDVAAAAVAYEAVLVAVA